MKGTLRCALAALAILCLMTSCSKNNDQPNKNIKPSDLKDNYIVALFTAQSKQYLSVIYFVNDSDTGYQAMFDEPGVRRAVHVTLQDDRFVFDLDANGAYILSFTFGKDSAGHVKLAASDFKQANHPESKLDQVAMIKVSDAPAFDGQTYTYMIPGADDETRLHFGAGSKWNYADYYGTTGQYSYYSIGNGIGWKCEDAASGGVSMGIMVPKWNGNGPTMLLKSTIDRLDAARIHMATNN